VKAVSEIRFNELHALRNIYEAKSDRTQRFLNSYADMTPLDSNDSNDSVFRFSERGLPLQGNYETPHRDVPPPAEIPPWRNLSEEEAVSAVMGGQSLFCQGSPGSGKTYFVRELVKALRKKGESVDIIAKTHASVQNFGEGAQTADHFVRQFVRSGGSSKCTVPVCEELTQLDVQLWADIGKVSQMADVSFILCGDFLHFLAISEFWAGSSVPEGSLERSHMVQDLAGSKRLTPTENKRSEEALADAHNTAGRYDPGH
jgi:hypothetical protein